MWIHRITNIRVSHTISFPVAPQCFTVADRWVTGAHAVCPYALNRPRGCWLFYEFQCISLASNLFEKLREQCSVPERKRKRSLTIRHAFYTNWFVIASYSWGSKRKRLMMLQSVKKPVGLFFLLELSFTAKCWNKLKKKITRITSQTKVHKLKLIVTVAKLCIWELGLFSVLLTRLKLWPSAWAVFTSVRLWIPSSIKQ